MLHGAPLLGVLFHSVTWLNLAPKAISLQMGRWRVPAGLVLGAHYLAWAVVTGAIIGLAIWRQG